VPSVLEVAEALADALQNVSPQFTMTVEPRMVFAPAADACIDIFPANPAEGDLAFGKTPRIYWFTIRLRVPTNDPDGAQDFLYAARDADGPESVRAALLYDEPLGGVADGLLFDANTPSGFYLSSDTANEPPKYLAEDWRVGVLVRGDS